MEYEERKIDPILCEGCGHELPKAYKIVEGIPLCGKCAEYDEQESECT